MAIACVAQNFADIANTGIGSLTITPSGSNRLLIIEYAGYSSSGNPTGLGTVTVDGNPATKITEIVYSSIAVVAMWYYIAPPASLITVAVNVGRPVGTAWDTMSVYALSGAKQSSPIKEYYSVGGSGPTYTFTAADIDGMTFAICCNTSGGGAWTVDTHQIEYIEYGFESHCYSQVLVSETPTCSADSGTERGFICAAVSPHEDIGVGSAIGILRTHRGINLLGRQGRRLVF